MQRLTKLFPYLLLLSVAWASAVSCSQEVTEPGDGVPQSPLIVTFDGVETEVDPSILEKVTISGLEAVALSAIVAEAELPETADSLLFDFESEDGFRPASKSLCTGLVPVQGTLLGKGYFVLSTRSLKWDEELSYPGCLHVGKLKYIHALTKEMPAEKISIVNGDSVSEVNLALFPTVEFNGAQVVSLDVLISANAGAPDLHEFDIEGGDGFRPTVDKGADPLSWDDFKQGYIHPASRDIVWPDEMGLDGFWSVSGAVKIHLLVKDVPSAEIEVADGDSVWSIDLGDLQTEKVDGADLVPLADVVAASEVEGPQGKSWKITGFDGFDPVEMKGLSPLSHDELAKGFIHPLSRDVSFPAASGIPKTWNVSDAARIETTAR